MSMSSGFIRRPVATALLMVAIVLLGGTAYTLLPVAALPNVSFPTISVTAQLPGADPQTMASSVATPLEKQFGEIPYLTQMTSTSSLGYTSITLQFALNDSIDAAAQLVQTAINAAAGQLPKDMPSPPTYHETNPSDAPILVLGLTSETLPITTVDDYAESILEQKISQVPGVGLVSVGGEQHPAVRIQFNPAQLASDGLDMEDVRTALTNVSVDQPKGSLYGKNRAFTLQTDDQILSADQWDKQIIAYRNGGPIRVSDVGKAIVGPQDETLRGWVNLHRGIILAIQRLPGANVISTVQAIQAALPQIEASIPPAIKVSVISDRTITIRASVADVQSTLLITMGLVVGVIFMFLRSVRATVIPAIAVPVSIVGTFGVMYAFGYSLDNLSLMGLSIAVGFVVDDAIVMVENIARHIEMGKTPMQAALDGAGEIGFTILSISISLVAVFIPLLMMSGMVGRMFQEFAVTVTVSIAVSVVVSLTLTPMMAARLLRQEHPEQQGRLSRGLEKCFDGLLAVYDRGLVVALRHRFITLMAMLATVAVTAWLFIIIPKGFFPEQDTGLILGVTEAAQDVSPNGMSVLQQQVIASVLKNPAVETAGAYIGAGGATSTENQGRVFIALKDKSQRPSITQVMTQLDQAVRSVQGVRLFMQPVQDVNIGGRLTATQYQYTLTDVDLSELNRWGPIIESALAKLPQLADVTSDQQSSAPQLTLSINRDVASRMGIAASQIDSVLYDAFGQRPIAQLYTSLNQYYVIMEVNPGFQLGPDALQRIYVRSQTSGMVPLSELVTQHSTVSPLSVNHQGQFPSVTVSFNLRGNVPLGPAVSAINQAMATLHVPPTISASFQGNAQAFQSSLSSTPILILAALIAVYLILGMLYENTIHPLTIISTLPAAGAGALVILLVGGFGLDVMGIIGIILLIGIVKKNGIMLVDFALEAERTRGLTAEESIYEACKLRFRPILMTTMCALLGSLPLMLGTGTGSELRQPLGYAMAGGLVVSQVLTLFTTPVVYIYMDKLARLRFRRSGRVRPQQAVAAE
ncbi:MAG: hydrophobic/amphiphilic exporter (mainly bacteria), family [Acetobacteraceae bacterium]|jgi:hydrophobe/amphiphile efflux-1 (HAE1) family protein|nr:acriflavin resistance protein [Rhodopila sp.]MEA2726507.1 hydrophobic/amphiphilic exporter (mainly bacteria), family [Acetobacteraceae bacterium]